MARAIKSSLHSRRRIIGIGNEYRGDDAAGLQVARRLKSVVEGSTEVIEHSGEGASLIESWRGAVTVLLVDAVSSGAPAGTIHRFDLIDGPLPNPWRCYSTHAFGVIEAIELSRALGELPPSLIFHGIEGKRFSLNPGLSDEVERAVDHLVQSLILQC